ncbi:hypothetical protein FQN50_005096 [Emmonsiellopsis sp. PD_5]|nr:hypothetical protein FQN50_005096 [Emmonsiellopsis sp. PD_5]
MGFLNLPFELFHEIFNYLPPEDLSWTSEIAWIINLRLVCKPFDHLVIDWLLRHFKDGSLDLDDVPLCADTSPSKIQMGIRMLTRSVELHGRSTSQPDMSQPLLVRTIWQGAEDAAGLLSKVHGQESFDSLRSGYMHALIKATIGCVTILGTLQFLADSEQAEMEFAPTSPAHIAMIGAATLGSLEDMEELITMGADIRAEHGFFGMPLLAAAFAGRTAAVQYLVDRGVDPRAKLSDGFTALHYAATAGEESVFRLLVDMGVEVDARTKYGETPLLCAAAAGNVGITRLLLEMGEKVDVNAQEGDDYTALKFAAHNGYEEVVKLLLAVPGILVQPRDEIDAPRIITPLMWAAQGGRENIVRLLLAQPDIDVNMKSPPPDEHTALSIALINRRTDVIKALLAYPDIDPNVFSIINDLDHVPIHLAAIVGYEEAVKLLLAHPVIAVDICDSMGNTALGKAAARGHARIVEMLLGVPEVDAAHVDEYGDTALMMAAFAGMEECVRVLMRHRYTYCRNNDSVTPLMAAASQGHMNVVKILATRHDVESIGDGIELLNVSLEEDIRDALEEARDGENADIAVFLESLLPKEEVAGDDAGGEPDSS